MGHRIIRREQLACIVSTVTTSTVSNNINRTRLFLLLSLHCSNSSRCNNFISTSTSTSSNRQKTATRRRSPRWTSACAATTVSFSKAQRPSIAFIVSPTTTTATTSAADSAEY
jgi:hypothetical protein